LGALVEVNGRDYNVALQWFNFNTSGGFVGETTPILVNVVFREPEPYTTMGELHIN
jgi:hypothetical protein